jgi:Flp pilus assembly protein TadD
MRTWIRRTGVLFSLLLLSGVFAFQAAAQGRGGSPPPPPPPPPPSQPPPAQPGIAGNRNNPNYNPNDPNSPGRPEDVSPWSFEANSVIGSSSLTIRVLNDDGQPLKGRAEIKLISTVTETTFLDGRSTFSATAKDGVAKVDQIPGGEYVLEVTSPDFAMGRDKVQVLGGNSSYEEVIRLHAFDGSEDQTQLNQPGVPPLPEDVQKELQLALTAIDANKAAAAEPHLRNAEKHDPDNPDVLYAAGFLADRLGHYQEAQTDYTKAIKVFPNHFAANYALGSLLLEQNRAAAALPYLLKAETVGPNSWRVHWQLSEAYLHADRDWQKGEFEANRALQIGKTKAADAEIPLAMAEVLSGKPDDARTRLQAFLHDHPKDPGDPEARAILAQLTPKAVPKS